MDPGMDLALMLLRIRGADGIRGHSNTKSASTKSAKKQEPEAGVFTSAFLVYYLMLMRIGRVKEEALFYTITLATFVLLLVLSILFLTRESRHNREMLETETVRLAGDLIEALGQRPFLSPQQLRPDVLGFGVYGPDGKAVNRFGSAPENGWALVPETERLRGRINRIEFKDDRLVILRTLGFPFMDRDSMGG
jgi:hypothetical protein